jgi:uncharacterized cupredoxin-like copper-binding protein
MRKIGLAAALMLLAACAGTSRPAPPTAGAPPAVAPAAKLAPADVDWKAAETVTVGLEDYRFAPDRLRFRRGTPYRLRLENRGTHQHEFTAPAFFGAVAARSTAALSPARPEIVVDPKQVKEFEFVPVTAGRYELFCADHDFAGMVGEITVE